MKRWLPLGIIMALILAAACCLSGTAIAPEAFTGTWYSAADGSVYVFREGIIACETHQISVSDDTIFSGSYSFSRDSVLVFAVGIDGLAEPQELYLVKSRDGDRLCENPDGSGTVYFYRNAAAASKG